MRKINSSSILYALIGILLIVTGLVATACSSASPTPAAPTLGPSTSVPIAPATLPGGQPTAGVVATLPSLPNAGGSPTLAVPTLAPTAAATPTAGRTATRPASQQTQPTAAKAAGLSGKIAFSVVTDPAPQFHGVWTANADGSGVSKVLDYASWPALSPNGKQLAFYMIPGGGKNEGLYVSDAFGGNPVPAYISPGVCCIDWSRDGSWIVFTDSARPKQPGGPIIKVKADGLYKTTAPLNVIGSSPAFSPDGKQVAFAGCLPNTNNCGLQVAAADGSGVLRTVTRDNGGNPKWSPNGARIVYQATDGSGHLQVWVVNADGTGKKQLTSGKSNDGQPNWSRDGGSIYWRSDQNGTAWAIYVMNADGSGQRRIIANMPPDPDFWGWESISVGP